jgi:hypothetical protein
MYGKGEGSKISMEFTMMHPGLVTAAIGYSWGAWLMPSETKESLDYANSAPEIYLTLGRRDLANHLSCVRDAYARLSNKGYHFIYREFDELGDRTYHPASNDDALAWATRQRNKNIPPSAEESKLLKAAAVAADGYYPSLALVGGAPAGAVLQKLFESKDANVRAAAAETCTHGIFGESTTTALAKLVSDPSVKVRQTAIRALGIYANWRYQPAQKALIQLALDNAAAPAERLNATDALGYAVRFQVKASAGIRPVPGPGLLMQRRTSPFVPPSGNPRADFEPGGGRAASSRARRRLDKWLNDITARVPRAAGPSGVMISPPRSGR